MVKTVNQEIFSEKFLFLPLLQEVLGVDEVLPDRRRLPPEICAGRVHLVKLGAVVVVARDEQRHPEWTNASSLCVLLHHSRRIPYQLPHRLDLSRVRIRDSDGGVKRRKRVAATRFKAKKKK